MTISNMNGYTKELKLVANGEDIFDLWVVEDGRNNLYIGKIEFESLKMEMCFNCNKKPAALPHECHHACEKYDICEADYCTCCDDCRDNCLL